MSHNFEFNTFLTVDLVSINQHVYDTQPMALALGNIPPLVRLLQAYIEKGSKVIVQEKKEVTNREQHVIRDIWLV